MFGGKFVLLFPSQVEVVERDVAAVDSVVTKEPREFLDECCFPTSLRRGHTDDERWRTVVFCFLRLLLLDYFLA